MGISGNLLDLMKSFLSERYQTAHLNGQLWEWENIKAGVPQGSVPEKMKLFADTTSIFSTTHDLNTLVKNLDHDLKKR